MSLHKCNSCEEWTMTGTICRSCQHEAKGEKAMSEEWTTEDFEMPNRLTEDEETQLRAAFATFRGSLREKRHRAHGEALKQVYTKGIRESEQLEHKVFQMFRKP